MGFRAFDNMLNFNNLGQMLIFRSMINDAHYGAVLSIALTIPDFLQPNQMAFIANPDKRRIELDSIGGSKIIILNVEEKSKIIFSDKGGAAVFGLNDHTYERILECLNNYEIMEGGAQDYRRTT